MGKIITYTAAIFFVLMVAGYFRNNNPEFKLRCAAYQAGGQSSLSLPDKMVCLTWYDLKH